MASGFSQLTKKLLFVLAGMMFSFCIHADISNGQVLVGAESFSQRLAAGVEYYVDESGKLDIEEVKSLAKQGAFKTYLKDTLHFGYSEKAHWLRFSVNNQVPVASEEQRFFISIRYPFLDSIQLFVFDDQQVERWEAGDLKPYYQREYFVNGFVFPVSLKKGKITEIYLRVQSLSSFSVPLYVETEKSFIERQHSIDSFNGIYLGVTIGLCIYNLFLLIGIRKSVYGYYVIAIVFLMLFNSTMIGYSYRLWPDWIHFQQISVYLFSISSGIAVCVFGMAFLKTKKYQPKMHRLLSVCVVAFLFCLPVTYFAPYQIAPKVNLVVVLTGIISVFIVAIRSVLQGYGPARYYLIGQGAVLFSVLFMALTSQGVLPFYFIAPEVMKWSSAFELIFFSIGLADLINNERKLREQAQAESAEAQQLLLDAQRKENVQLDQLVRQRTEELEQANLRLEELNITDELTGLRNRRYLNQVFVAEYKRAFRERHTLAVLMLDIDNFKSLNDTYGHLFGDICLSKAGDNILASINRATDIAVRYGGEEFVVVLPKTDEAGACKVAEDIRALFESTPISGEGHTVTITVSVGVAVETPTHRENHERLLKRADELLYDAKTGGRNQAKMELVDLGDAEN